MAQQMGRKQLWFEETFLYIIMKYGAFIVVTYYILTAKDDISKNLIKTIQNGINLQPKSFQKTSLDFCLKILFLNELNVFPIGSYAQKIRSLFRAYKSNCYSKTTSFKIVLFPISKQSESF